MLVLVLGLGSRLPVARCSRPCWVRVRVRVRVSVSVRVRVRVRVRIWVGAWVGVGEWVTVSVDHPEITTLVALYRLLVDYSIVCNNLCQIR